MNTRTMPHRGEMITAFLSRDGSCDGVFFTGVLTTGIFCRPTCLAKKPREDNVEFFSSTQAALLAGFRSSCGISTPSRRGAGRMEIFETGDSARSAFGVGFSPTMG